VKSSLIVPAAQAEYRMPTPPLISRILVPAQVESPMPKLSIPVLTPAKVEVSNQEVNVIIKKAKPILTPGSSKIVSPVRGPSPMKV